MRVFDEGEWHLVLIDDYIPVQGLRVSCARSRDPGECWVMLVEKAFAKMHTCYQSMVGGGNTYCFGPGNVLRLLTGSPSGRLSQGGARPAWDADEMWGPISSRTDKQWLVGTGTKHDSATGKLLGLVGGHAYSIIGTVVIDGQFRLLRIRNTCPSRFCRTLFSIESAAFHSHGLDFNSVY